ncbi:MAG: hypothetical protein MUC87_17870 [Bacteroidia bacterium]|jgi:hypothetical protein|nr:hypothetical protein [Bacteroidia bacterium]
MKNDPLWHLVHALTQSEKRQFVLENSEQKPTSGFMALYHWYTKQDEPSSPDAAVLKKLKLTPATLAVQKNYLNGKLTDFLARAVSDNTDTLQIRQLISQAEALFQRGLRDHAKKIVRRAFQLAEYAELFIYQLALYELLENYALHNSDFQELIDFDRKKLAIMRILETEIACHRLSADVIALGTGMDFARTPAEKKRIKETAAHPLMLGEEAMPSLRSRYHLTHARIHFYNMTQDSVRMVKLCLEHFQFFDKNPELAGRDIAYFVSMSFNMVVNLIQLGHPHQVKDVINRWERLPVEYKPAMTDFFLQQHQFFSSELAFRKVLLEGKPELLIREMPRVQKLKSSEHQYQQVYINSIRFYEALAAYFAGKRKDALRYLIDELQDESIMNRRYRLVMRSMLLRLMIHCDEEHDDVVEELAKQLDRFIRRHQCQNFSDGIMAAFFKKWPGLTATQRKSLHASTIKKIENCYSEQRDWQFAINYRFCMAWMHTKAGDISFGKALLHCNRQFYSQHTANHTIPQ